MQHNGSALGTSLAHYKRELISVAILSVALNIIVLAGSFYMMMVYDSVLPSGSVATLVGLFIMVSVVYIFQGAIELVRARLFAFVGAGLERRMAPHVHAAMSRAALNTAHSKGDGLSPMRDLDIIRAFLSSGGPPALLDLPWIIFFAAILTSLHYWLGITAIVGALLLFAVTIAAHRAGKAPTRQLADLTARRQSLADANIRKVETLTGLGMRSRMYQVWQSVNAQYLDANDAYSRTSNALGTASKVLRLFLQSLILTVGAMLVIRGEATGGIIFAASLLFGRALAPVDQAIANWRNFANARAGWDRLNAMFVEFPTPTAPVVQLFKPNTELSVDSLCLAPPGSEDFVLRGLGFTVEAGCVVGVIGPSGAGKTTLAKALAGIWQADQGAIRLDNAHLDQWSVDHRGAFIGYLSQSVDLFDGTIGQNIARFDPEADSASVIAAAMEAGVHEMIVKMPAGYETRVGQDGRALSAGQQQRIGLARALFGDPFLVVLDEPNSNLDQDGDAALERAVERARMRGAIILLVSHRPSLLAHTTHVLFLRDGRMDAFGKRDEVLSRVIKPVADLGGKETTFTHGMEALK